MEWWFRSCNEVCREDESGQVSIPWWRFCDKSVKRFFQVLGQVEDHPTSSIIWRSCLILFLVAIARSYPPATRILSTTFLHLLVLWGSQRLVPFMLWRYIFKTSWREMDIGLVLESSQSRLHKVSTMRWVSLGQRIQSSRNPSKLTKPTEDISWKVQL